MTATPQRLNLEEIFTMEVPEDRAPILRIAPMKRIKQELPELSKATDDAQIIAHTLNRLSGAIDPAIETGNDCLERLHRGGIRSLLNKLTANLEALGV